MVRGLRRSYPDIGDFRHADRGGDAPAGASRAGRSAGTGKADGQVPYGIQIGVAMERAYRHRAAARVDAAGVNVHRVALEGADDVLDGQSVGIQQGRVHRHEDLLVDAAFNLHVKDARHRLERRYNLPLDYPEQVGNVALARYAQLHHRAPVGRQLKHARVAGGVREPEAGDSTDDFRLRFFDINGVFKTGLYPRVAGS